MGWIEKEKPTMFDDMPIQGLQFLDGDVLAAWFKKDWTKGYKIAQIEFPSGVACELWETGVAENLAIVHLFGEMDLPLADDRDRAFQRAYSVAEECGYWVEKRGEDAMFVSEMWGASKYVVRYDNELRVMVDVIALEDE